MRVLPQVVRSNPAGKVPPLVLSLTPVGKRFGATNDPGLDPGLRRHSSRPRHAAPEHRASSSHAHGLCVSNVEIAVGEPYRRHRLLVIGFLRHEMARRRAFEGDLATLGAAKRKRLPASTGKTTRKIGPMIELALYWMKSAHFCTAVSAAPQGMIGTLEVEFLGEPSISLSE